MRIEKRKRIILTVAFLSIAMVLTTILYAGIATFVPLETKDRSSSGSDIDVEIVPTESILANPIHIDNTAGNNWEWAKAAGICIGGDGTEYYPYIIEDLYIDAGGSAYGILIENSNVYFWIESCETYDAISGIKLSNTNNGFISENIAKNNYNYGIYLQNSHNNTILGNTANNNKFGILLEESHGNTVLENTANKNSIGIELRSSNNNIILKNTVSNNKFHGILLSSWSSHNTVIRNTGTYNWMTGIYLTYSNNNIVSGNLAYGNWIGGITVVYSNDNTLGGNAVGYNRVFEIRFIGGTNNVILGLTSPIHIDNTAGNNWEWAKAAGICTGFGTEYDPYIIQDLIIDAGGSGSGIIIENSNAYFRIENCIIYNSGRLGSDAGIRLENTNNGEIINNYCSTNYYGIYLSGGDYNTISGNIVIENGFIGIEVGSIKNNITGNIVYYGFIGIEVWSYSYENTVSGNIIYKNNYGIFLDYVYGNTVSKNIIYKNTWIGIRIEYGDGNEISENFLYYNGWELYSYGITLSYSNSNSGIANILRWNTYEEWSHCEGNDIEIIYLY